MTVPLNKEKISKIVHNLVLMAFLSIVPSVLSLSAFGAEDGDSKSKTSKPSKLEKKYNKRFEKAKKQFRNGSIDKREYWTRLNKLFKKVAYLDYDNKINLIQASAQILKEQGFPIAASLYSSQAIILAKSPTEKRLKPSWELLYDISKEKSTNALLEILAISLHQKFKNFKPPYFQNNWNFYVGNALDKKGEFENAIKSYEKLQVSDKYFAMATYQKAMLLIDQNDLAEAEKELSMIVHPSIRSRIRSKLPANEELFNLTYLALGRVNYEQQNFRDSYTAYRHIKNESRYYYDALFEQSWAFFMAGLPNHALGALHSVESPFFENRFNPEAGILRSSIYYWTCNYEDAKVALREFLEKHADNVEKLASFVGNRKTNPESAYEIFENLINGVSPETIGLSKDILDTAATSESMMYLRDQFADVVEELNRLKKSGIVGKGNQVERVERYLDKLSSSMQTDIGNEFGSELKDLKELYDSYYEQAQFLYVELLMSEKDKLMGKELHASSKITEVTKKDGVKGWGRGDYSWKRIQSDEYWWDEIGHYIYTIQPQCNLKDDKN